MPKKAIQIVALFSIIVTICLGIYSAQPWGDNETFQSFFFYVILFLMQLWSVSPYIFLFIVSDRTFKKSISYYLNAVIITAITIGGIFLTFDAIIINPDAQSGLTFIVLPFYQWALLMVWEIILFIIKKKG